MNNSDMFILILLIGLASVAISFPILFMLPDDWIVEQKVVFVTSFEVLGVILFFIGLFGGRNALHKESKYEENNS